MTDPGAVQSTYLFLLGFAAGVALLAATGYRHTSPVWMRCALFVTAAMLVLRYVSLAAFASVEAPESIWVLRHFWFASSVALTFPSLVAVDNLVRHPAVTPRRLLAVYGPFLAAYAALILFGHFTAQPDAVMGWTLKLTRGWSLLVCAVQSAFVALFVGLCAFLIRKVPDRRIRVPLAALALGHLWLAADGVLLAFGGWYFRPFLFSEIYLLLCLWAAFETASFLQRSP